MKTVQPMILTARIAAQDIAVFERLRQEHFPRDRNYLAAHLTMFHRLPGECLQQMLDRLAPVAAAHPAMVATVGAVRHLGAGVAFTVASEDLAHVHVALRSAFASWLGGQDMQKWQPHITVQNKVPRSVADDLHRQLSADFKPHPIRIEGMDLWEYLGGPWRHERFLPFGATTDEA